MTVQNYAVTSTQPISVYPAGQQGTILVRNTGANAVLLSDIAGGQGFELGATSAMSWAEGKPLYVAAKSAAQPSAIVIVDNDGSIFDASAIAGQIIAQGLAGDIADAITASTLASAIATNISINGAPPIDDPFVFASGDAVDLSVDPVLCAKYQTLFIVMQGDLFNGVLDDMGLQVTQYWDPVAADNEIGFSTFVTKAANGYIVAAIPLRGTYFAAFAYLNGGSIITPDVAKVHIVGSLRSAPAESFMYPGQAMGSSANVGFPAGGGLAFPWGQDRATSWSWSVINASQSRNEFPSIIPGEVQVSAIIGTVPTAGTLTVTILDAETFYQYATMTYQAGAARLQTIRLLVPNRAVIVQYTTSAGFLPINNSLNVNFVNGGSPQ